MKYVEKREGVKTPALEFGSLVHEVLEDFILGRKEPPPHLDRICQESKESLKDILIEPFEIEKAVSFDFGPLIIRGFVDLIKYEAQTNTLHIVDHKTCSESWTYDKKRKVMRGRFYGITREEVLRKDIQLNLYAFLGTLSYMDKINNLETLKIVLTHNQIVKVKTKKYIKELNLRRISVETDFDSTFELFKEFFKEAKKVQALSDKIKRTGVEELNEIYGVSSPCELADKWQYGAINPFWDHYKSLEK